jgi:hypothetical protein
VDGCEHDALRTAGGVEVGNHSVSVAVGNDTSCDGDALLHPTAPVMTGLGSAVAG